MMDSFKVSTMKKNEAYLRKMCLHELECLYVDLIQEKVAKGTYFIAGGYKQYREDFADLRNKLVTRPRRPGVDSNFVSNLDVI